MDNVPGIITAVGGLPPSIFVTLLGVAFVFWGSNYMKWNRKATIEDRVFRKILGAIIMGVGFLWMLTIAFLPYFIGGPK